MRVVRPLQQGFTLIELMIGLSLSLLVVLAVTSTFVNGMQTRTALERSTALIENGRFAMDTLIADLQVAGFFAEIDTREARATKDVTADLPDPCDTTLAQLNLSWPFAIQGYDGDAELALNCVADWKKGTDVVLVRRVSTCVAGTAGCPMEGGLPYFQTSGCNDAAERASADADDWYALHSDPQFLLKTQRDCATPAPLRRYRQHLYFVANNDLARDGRPTLKRMVLGANGWTEEPLANGIEDLQLEYGIDTDNDGAPDQYTANPTTFNGCADADCRRDNWRNVTTVQAAMLVQSLERIPGLISSKTFVLGRDADGVDITRGPYSDQRERQVFSSSATLRNIAGVRR